MDRAGISREMLPFLYPYGREKMCYHGILGYCSKEKRGKCKLVHPSPDEVNSPGFAQALVSKLQPGVDDILQHGLDDLPLDQRKRKFGQ